MPQTVVPFSDKKKEDFFATNTQANVNNLSLLE